MKAVPDVASRSLHELVSLAGRSAVVTGGARGLGRGIALRLAEAGARVLVADLDLDVAETAAEGIRQAGGDAVATLLDVRDSARIAAVADEAVARFGGLDIWVNNAGIYPLSPVIEMTDEQWDGVIEINLRGTFMGCREAAKRMVAGDRGGVIVNISSTSGTNGGGPSISHYVAAKHGVNGITKAVALEMAPHGIRVLSVSPTVIVTEGVEVCLGGTAAAAGFDLQAQTRLGRAGVPDDIARVVLFCASDLSLFMTGSVLLVDAGALTH